MKKTTRVANPLPLSKESALHFPTPWLYAGTLWMAIVLATYLVRYPVPLGYLSAMFSALTDFGFFHPYMGKVLIGFGVAGIFLCLMGRGGMLAIQMAGAERRLTPGEGWILGTALATGLLSTLTLGLGVFHLWNSGVFIILAVSVALWEISVPWVGAPGMPVRPGGWTGLWKIFLAFTLLLYLLGAAAPEIFYDSLHYHLAIPNLFHFEHRVLSVPTMLYADFVMSLQLVYGVMITVGNTLSAKALHVGFSIVLAAGFVLFAKRFFSSASGWLAALLFFSMPMVAVNATTAGTDVAGAFLLFASVAALAFALDAPSPRSFQWAGALTGIAASTKYPAFVFIPLAALLIGWHFQGDMKKSWREWMPYLLHFLSMALLFLAPILLKNMVFHGNPLYPFGGTTLGHPRLDPVEWHKFLADTSPRDWRLTFSSATECFHWLAAPWFIVFDGQRTIGPLLTMGLPFLLRRSQTSLPYRLFQRYALLLWIVWLCTSTVPRYGLPAMVLACPLLAEAVIGSLAASSVRWLVLGCLSLGLCSNLAFQWVILYSWEGWQVVAGQMTENAYLGRMHQTYPTPPYDGLLWMNENLASNARILFVGESRSYYLKRRSIPSSIPGPQPIVTWSHEAKTGAALAEKMQAMGVTHIFLNLMEARRTDGYHEFYWDAGSWAVLDDFWIHHTRLIWKKEVPDHANPQALYVFEVIPVTAALPAQPPSPNPFLYWKP